MGGWKNTYILIRRQNVVERYGQDSWCALSEVSAAVIYGDAREIEISNN